MERDPETCPSDDFAGLSGDSDECSILRTLALKYRKLWDLLCPTHVWPFLCR